MTNSWRRKRQLTFISIFILIILAFTFYKIYPYLNPAPTCFDNKQNGEERGVDCGGGCPLICKSDIYPIEERFSRFIETEDNLYDFVAMINNKNVDKMPEGGMLEYNFTIYDMAGNVAKVVNGSTPVMIGQTFPIVAQNVPIDFGDSGNAISRVTFNVLNNEANWVAVDEVFKNNFFRVINTEFIPLKNNVSQLNVSLQNITRAYFRDVPVRVLLLDEYENVFAVNETLIKEIDGNGTIDLNFSWRVPLKKENPKIEVYPIVTPNTYLR